MEHRGEFLGAGAVPQHVKLCDAFNDWDADRLAVLGDLLAVDKDLQEARHAVTVTCIWGEGRSVVRLLALYGGIGSGESDIDAAYCRSGDLDVDCGFRALRVSRVRRGEGDWDFEVSLAWEHQWQSDGS